MPKLFCPYCGNNSGKTDARGMCISCGGGLEEIKPTQETRDYPGHSGSSYLFGEMGREIFSPNVPLLPLILTRTISVP